MAYPLVRSPSSPWHSSGVNSLVLTAEGRAVVSVRTKLKLDWHSHRLVRALDSFFSLEHGMKLEKPIGGRPVVSTIQPTGSLAYFLLEAPVLDRAGKSERQPALKPLLYYYWCCSRM